MTRIRTAILISGRGSNMRALVDAAAAPGYPAEIVLVLSNRPEAAGLAFAAKRGIATAVVDHKAFGKDRPAFEQAMQAELARHGVDFICLAGFMRVLTAGFVRVWDGRMLNIHPSLLPKFPGVDTHARALAAGESEHGCTVHFVVPEVDAGPIVAQARVPVLPDDTEASLAERVLAEEWKLYPVALRTVLAEPRETPHG
jgi:phosphoribosylglycinamide formyltransferase-1